MLVLTRKGGQGIIIGENIRIVVLGFERDRVKLGIEAPNKVHVLREELLERDPKRGPFIPKRDKEVGTS